MSSARMSTSHIVHTRYWTSLCLAFIGAVCFSSAVLFSIRYFQIPSSDAAVHSVSIGFPFVVMLVVLLRGFLLTRSPFTRFSLASLFSLILAAAAFLLAFILVWAVYGGSAP
jgi:hypothetical protein